MKVPSFDQSWKPKWKACQMFTPFSWLNFFISFFILVLIFCINFSLYIFINQQSVIEQDMKVLIDTLCFIFLYTCLLAGFYYFEPTKRGFWCNDYSIKYPYHPMMVSFKYILFLALVGPNSLLLLIHLRPYRLIKNYNYGLVVNITMLVFVKFLIGRLRPNFWSLCKPDIDCSHPSFQDQFIVNYNCTNSELSSYIIKEARLSFYSGHSSISIYVATFIIFWLSSFVKKSNTLLIPLIQYIIFLIGIFPGLTQIVNYWHHWNDVLSGFVIGTGLSYITFYHFWLGLLNLFKDFL